MGDAFLVSRGGGTGKLFAAIGVTYPEGSTLTCTDGTKTLKAKTTTGQWVFSIPCTGTWTVTATDGTNTKSRSVEITEESQVEILELFYELVLFDSSADGLKDGFSLGGLFSINSSKLYFNPGEDKTGSAYLTPSVDCTGFDTMHVSFTATLIATTGSYGYRVGLAESTSGTWNSNYVAVASSGSGGTAIIDISSLTGSYYFKAGVGSGRMSISKIWFD